MNDDEMDDETRRFLRGLFADLPPRDVVPGEGLTREDLRRMNDATNRVVEMMTPGEVVCDVDGMPIGVEPPRVQSGYLGGVTITQTEADRLGWTAEEFPNVRVMPDPIPRDDD